jgi:hypothetical protein
MKNNRDKFLEQILLLEYAGVGCGPQCVCRAAMAISLTPEQAAALEEKAKHIIFDNQEPIGEDGVLALLGKTATEKQVKILRHIAHDKTGPDAHPEEKGGLVWAERTLDIAVTVRSPQSMRDLIGAIFGQDADDTSEEDLFRAAFDRQ